jgi:Ca2+-binding RTX toxin-like protein
LGVSVTGIASTDVAAGNAIDSYGDTDTLIRIQNADGTSYDDLMVGGVGHNNFDSGDGNDILQGGEGDDQLNAGAGNDVLEGGAGGDYLNAGFGFDTVTGGDSQEWDTLGFGWGQATEAGDGLTITFDANGIPGGGVATGAYSDGTDGEGNPRHGFVNVTFSGIEHVEGSSGDDAFTAGAGFAATAQGAFVWADGRGTGLVDVSGGDGSDTFVDSSDASIDGVTGGAMIVSYDGDKWSRPNFDGHLWGSEVGEHGVVVNLSGVAQTATSFDFNDGAPLTDVTVAAQSGLDLYGKIDTFSGVQAVWLTQADDWFWADDTRDTFVGGAEGDDHLFGGAGNDTFYAGNGADIVAGGAGDDTIRYDWHDPAPMGLLVNYSGASYSFPGGYTVVNGGIRDTWGNIDIVSGVEELIGSQLRDFVIGGSALTTIRGEGGNDTLLGGAGSQSIYGGEGDDEIQGGYGVNNDVADYLDGGAGNDTIAGDKGDDEIRGGDGQDTLNGNEGNDTIYGDDMADIIIGHSGDDVLHGGDGDDLLIGGAGDDIIDGGAGDTSGDGIDLDIVNYAEELSSSGDGESPAPTGLGVIVNLSSDQIVVGSQTVEGHTAIDRYGSTDTFTNIEGVTGTQFADTLVGDDVDNRFTANAGNDTVQGNRGNDWISGGIGDDTIYGGEGIDTIDGGGNNDVIFGDGGSDVLTGGTGDDDITGGAGDDTIDGYDGTDIVRFSGNRSDYLVEAVSGGVRVTDLRAEHDGSDTITGVEQFAFADITLDEDGLFNLAGDLVDADAGVNRIDENAAIGSVVGLTAFVQDPNGASVNYVLSSNPGGLFAIDATTGVVTSAAAIDFESVGSVATIEVTANASDGSVSTQSYSIEIGNVDDRPDVGNTTVTMAEDGNYVLRAADFPWADQDAGSAFHSVVIYSAPAAGTLYFDGAPLTAATIGSGFEVSAADLDAGKLSFAPAPNGNGTGYASFSYAVATTANSDLVAAWSFENSGEDITTNTMDVGLYGGAGYAAGLHGQGVDLNGVPGTFVQEVADSHATDFGSNDFTVSLWFRTDDTSGREQTLIEDFESGGGPGWTLTHRGGSSLQFYASGAGPQMEAYTGSIGDGDWHQAVITRSGDLFALYFDGQQIATTTSSAPLATGPNGLLIGARNAVDGRNFALDGQIDDVALWSRGLTSSEVAAQWNNGNGVAVAPNFPPQLSEPATLTIDVTAVNDGPTIKSLGGGDDAVASVQEGDLLAATVSATDIDGPTVSYAIVGGADAARFTINSETGALSFVAAPDYEAPADADGNNTYEVTVTASDGLASDSQSITVSVTNRGGVTINGTAAADTIDATHTPAGQPFVTEEEDTIFGNGGNDVIWGLGGNDTINGGAGTDTMRGGTGNDTYVVDGVGDVVLENAGEGVDTVLSSVTFTLAAEVENLVLTGTANINGTGNAGNNALTGNTGNNVLNGGAGADVMAGATGNDTYVVDDAGDTVVEGVGEGTDLVQASVNFQLGANVENLTLTGTSNVNATGNGDNNVLTGNSGNNVLDGGIGSDTLIGGAGNDLYIVDDLVDVVTEAANAGTDTVQFFGSGAYTLGTNVENLTLSGLATNGTGNTLANTIVGNALDNVLSGGAGADTLIGQGGNDTYIVDNVADIAVEVLGGGRDIVQASVSYTLGSEVEDLTLTGTAAINATGNELNNVLIGNTGANILTGAGGDDVMAGGAGNDTYVVDSLGDIVDEASNGGLGVDLVQSAISFNLSSANVLGDVERLTLLGSGNINGTGNTLGNLITGNSGNNVLDGGTGADTLVGGLGDDTYVTDGGDTITEAADAGTDTVNSSVSYTLGANLENLVLVGAATIGTGNALNNQIFGNSLANTLSGSAGDDAMFGGSGDDIYIADSSADQAVESAGEGLDTVQSSVTFTLGANVENLTLTGTLAINGTGNELANVILGNAAANILSGGGGNDTLNGGAGTDAMAGGTGDDLYIVDNIGDTVSEVAGEGNDTVQSEVSYSLSADVETLLLTGTANINATGNSGANTLIGNSGTNVLNGGLGADLMIGGAGNDTYVVDDLGDIVDELTNGGTGADLIQSSISFSLAYTSRVFGEVERLTLTGLSNLNATGNAAANVLTGNSGANILDGGAGIDTLIGGLGNDTYIADVVGDVVTEAASAGTDTVIFTGAAGNFVLATNVENLTLGGSAAIDGTGNTLANVLIGNGASNILSGGGGNDTLNGGAGADTLIGGSGNDTYVVDNANDLVDEATGGSGIDTVQSSVNFSLIADAVHVAGAVENLILTGSGSIIGTGNSLDNTIMGNSGANTLFGGAGDDTLSGNAGNDTLIGGLGHDFLFGGAGSDTFDFNVADFGGATGSVPQHSDEIFDFSLTEDRIDLSGLLDDAIAMLGGNANAVLRASMVGADMVVEVNESAVLDWSPIQQNWGQAIVIHDVADANAVQFVFAGQTWNYDNGVFLV